MMEYAKMKQIFLNVDLMVEIVVSHTGISLWTVKIVHVMNLLGFHFNLVSMSAFQILEQCSIQNLVR